MMDPVSFWMQANLFWIKVYQSQQETYLRVLCSMAKAVPHESAAEIAAEAEAMKSTLKPASRTTPRATQRSTPQSAKPAARKTKAAATA
ncbi:hypothetical protein [Roseinatronobacter sp. S2]|uniref:hypothetical protein n=1 Tax=Roseinatronobacter sp. S2 TaxID=3035471 RepID=UPI0024104B88|nr:hypothetical protein [Roseinatronobacter sp. S2]WFE73729.1 hypothetical protein P8S53_11090 [Roseinatronobacter sp. S2]